MRRIDPKERAHRNRVRVRITTAMLQAYGYALLGGAVWEPITQGEAFTSTNAGLAVLALAMHGFALYIAPGGEKR